MAIAGQTFRPIATPVTFAGVSQKTLDAFSSYFLNAGILPVATAASNSPISPLKPHNENTLLGGDSVVVHLARGDIDIAAAGTVTLRDDEKIFAFGHPFFSLGATSLPMSESHVVTVVPNVNNSFKLAVADALVGTMTQDRATGIYGNLGKSPRMLPVKIKFTNSRGRSEEMNFESAFDELLTPLIVTVGVTNTIVAQERNIGDTTIEVKGEIAVRGEQPIAINRRFAGNQAVQFASSSAAVPLAALLRSNFDGLDIAGITLNIKAIDGSKTAVLDRISVDKTQVRAGEAIEVTAFERTESGKIIEQKIPIKIPADASTGQLTITVGDGNAVQQSSAVTQFTPRNATELIATINRLKRPDRLYAVLTRTTTGAVVGASEMPNLPPSMLATMNNDRTAGGAKPTIQTTIFETELPSLEYIVFGTQTLMIEVIK
jgi:predicted secreted protein